MTLNSFPYPLTEIQRVATGYTTCEKLSISQLTETHRTGQLVFEKTKQYFELNEIPLKNLIRIATYGAPSMIGRHRVLIT